MTIKSDEAGVTNDLDGFRSEEPTARGVEPTPAALQEDDAPAPARADAPPQQQQQRPDPRQPTAEQLEEHKALQAKLPDNIRSQIGNKFAKTRNADMAHEFDGDPTKLENQFGNLAKPQQDEPAEPAAPAAPAPAADADNDEFTLVVRGQTLTKSVEEIAALAEMSVDEVKADPKRAQRYAGRELATQQNLEESRQARRPTAARQDDADNLRTARPAPDQGRDKPGEEGSDQPDADRRPSGTVDFRKLAETLQVEDADTAAKSLEDAFKEHAKAITTEAVTHVQANERVAKDRTGIQKGMSDFVEAHPEVKGNDYIAAAMAPALVEEYRADLAKVLVSEGHSKSEAARMVKDAQPDKIAQAHREARISGHPGVRQIEKGLFEAAYARVTKGLGVQTQSSPQQQEQPDLQTQRQERKANLQPQPRRASVPPSNDQQSAAPVSRSAVVAGMAARTGRKSHATR